MKVSVSLPADDVAYLDAHVRSHAYESRSAALHAAVRLMRSVELMDDYTAAWDDWAAGGDEPLWDTTTGDGVVRAQE